MEEVHVLQKVKVLEQAPKMALVLEHEAAPVLAVNETYSAMWGAAEEMMI